VGYRPNLMGVRGASRWPVMPLMPVMRDMKGMPLMSDMSVMQDLQQVWVTALYDVRFDMPSEVKQLQITQAPVAGFELKLVVEGKTVEATHETMRKVRELLIAALQGAPE